MSRSRRKTPIIGITTARSDKPFKVIEHRKERRAVNIALERETDPPAPKLFGDTCKSCKDGKLWTSSKTLERYPKLMRK